MEPTEGRSIVVDFQTDLSVDEFRIQLYNHPIVQQIALAEFQQTFQSHSSLRLRGGMSPRNEYVNNDSKFNEIPYLTNMKFLWNGRPCIDFNLKVMFQIDNGLGSITVGSDTLLKTAQLTDEGGALGKPSADEEPYQFWRIGPGQWNLSFQYWTSLPGTLLIFGSLEVPCQIWQRRLP